MGRQNRFVRESVSVAVLQRLRRLEERQPGREQGELGQERRSSHRDRRLLPEVYRRTTGGLKKFGQVLAIWSRCAP